MTRIVIAGGRTNEDGQSRLVQHRGAAGPQRRRGSAARLFRRRPESRSGAGPAKRTRTDAPRVAELELELEATRTELQGAIHNLEISGEEQKAINEEALSVQEEYQSTNEELLTSKEELQSLNEELTALNSQLQETLERQRTTSNDLQNVLYSTDVATLFLDKSLQHPLLHAGDEGAVQHHSQRYWAAAVGPELAGRGRQSCDRCQRRFCKPSRRSSGRLKRENGACFIRRILPYRTQNNGVEGVVITFADITERQQVADELGVAKRQAEHGECREVTLSRRGKP